MHAHACINAYVCRWVWRPWLVFLRQNRWLTKTLPSSLGWLVSECHGFFSSISTFPTQITKAGRVPSCPAFLHMDSEDGTRVLLAYPCIFIYLTCENHTPPKVPVDQERAKNSVAFSAWFSQVSSSYHRDTSQAHRKKLCGSEHLGKSRPWRLVQVGLHQEPSSRDRLVEGKPLIIIISKAWRFLKTHNLFPGERRGWTREEGRNSGEWTPFPSCLTMR